MHESGRRFRSDRPDEFLVDPEAGPAAMFTGSHPWPRDRPLVEAGDDAISIPIKARDNFALADGGNGVGAEQGGRHGSTAFNDDGQIAFQLQSTGENEKDGHFRIVEDNPEHAGIEFGVDHAGE